MDSVISGVTLFCSPRGKWACGQDLEAEKQLSGGRGGSWEMKEKKKGELGRGPVRGYLGHSIGWGTETWASEFGGQSLEPDCLSESRLYRSAAV